MQIKDNISYGDDHGERYEFIELGDVFGTGSQ